MNKKFDGITVGGKSVEEYLTDQTVKDILHDLPVHHYPKRKTRLKMTEHKESHGPVTLASKIELAQKNLDANVASARTHAEKIIAYLLTGRSLDSKDIMTICAIKQQGDASTVMKRIKNSQLGVHVKKTIRNRRSVFSFTDEGLALSFEQAITFFRGSKATSSSGRKATSSSGRKATSSSGRKATSTKWKEIYTPDQHRFKIEGPPSLNINVSGKVEVVFRWEK